MVKCPFCSYANEDGALFCEQCKSDISSVTPSAPSAPPPTPMPESLPAAEAPVMAAIVEDAPVAAVMVEEPVAAVVVEEVAGVAVAVPVEAPPAAAPVAEAPAAAAPPAPPKAATGTPIAPGAQPKLVVQRGLKIGEEYNIFAGENFVGRADDKPVDVDLTFQEPEDRVWTSRQHALLVYDDATGTLTVEDLNSANGTFVNRERVYPGQPKQLFVGSTIQIGTVHMRIKA